MMNRSLRQFFVVSAGCPLVLMLLIRTASVAVAQCPCSAVKLGVDTTKGMKFDTVAYYDPKISSKASTQLLFEYAAAKSSLLQLRSLLYDSLALDTNELQELTVKTYGTRTPLPYDYISYVTLSRKGATIKDFKYKLTLVIKDSAWAGDTILLDTVKTSLANVSKTLDSLTTTLGPTLRWLQNRGQNIGVDTIRGVTFDQKPYQQYLDSLTAALNTLLNNGNIASDSIQISKLKSKVKDATKSITDYAMAKGIADSLLAFYTNQEYDKGNHHGVAIVPFGFVEGDIDLGKGVSGNGTSTFAIKQIKNNYWVLDTITMINTTSDTITVQKMNLGQSQYFKLDTILTKMPLPASIPVGGALQAVIYICHSSDTSPVSTEPIITDPLTIFTAQHNPQTYTLQAQPVHPSNDYVASATLDRKGKVLDSFYYKLTILIKETTTGDTVKYDTLDDRSLGNIPQDLITMVKSFSPTLHLLRAYQAKIREDSGNYIALKYTIVGAPSKIKSGETSTLLVRVFDCDGAPARGKHFDIGLKAGNESTLSESQITTDDNGSATVTLTGGSKAEVAKASLHYTYISATHHLVGISNCNSKSVTVGAPYTLTVEGSLHVHVTKNASGNTGDFDFNGTAPMELQITKDDTCGKWVMLDDVTFTLTGNWVNVDPNNGTTTCTYSGGSYTSPATFVMDCPGGTSGTLHIDHIGPSTEDYSCTGKSSYNPSGAGAGINTILLGCFNASKMENAQAEGQDKIAQIKTLAAKAQAERAAGDPHAREDYMALMNLAKGGIQSSGGLSGLSFNFKDAVDKNGSPAFDNTPSLDVVHGAEDKITSATIHVKIEKNE